MEELTARIYSLIRRYTWNNRGAADLQPLSFDGLTIDPNVRCVTTDNGTIELPPKEFDLPEKTPGSSRYIQMVKGIGYCSRKGV